MKMRMLFLAMIPCLMVVGCGMETEPVDDSLRGNQADEPCTPDDCIPLAPQVDDGCPEGTEAANGAECVNVEGECIWEFWEACVPIVEGGGDPPPPPPEWVPPPSEAPPREIAPRPK